MREESDRTPIDQAQALLRLGVSTAGLRVDWEAPEPAALDAALDDYEVHELLGRGGMGAVYRATQKGVGRQVAVKILPPEIAADPSFAERFRREVEAMGSLEHPNIVRIYAAAELHPGSPASCYFAMELIEGTDLSRLMLQSKIDPARATGIAIQIADALAYAHGAGYIHRDIKPANVFIAEGDVVKVGDFGLAKLVGAEDEPAQSADLTLTGTTIGTRNYLAPESLAGGEADHRADIYSLGILLYEMLTGRIPRGVFKMPSALADTDPALDTIVTRALEQDPEDRYPDIDAMRLDLLGRGTQAKKRRRKTLRTIILTLACLSGLALATAVILPLLRGTPEEQQPVGPVLTPLPPAGLTLDFTTLGEEEVAQHLNLVPFWGKTATLEDTGIVSHRNGKKHAAVEMRGEQPYDASRGLRVQWNISDIQTASPLDDDESTADYKLHFAIIADSPRFEENGAYLDHYHSDLPGIYLHVVVDETGAGRFSAVSKNGSRGGLHAAKDHGIPLTDQKAIDLLKTPGGSAVDAWIELSPTAIRGGAGQGSFETTWKEADFTPAQRDAFLAACRHFHQGENLFPASAAHTLHKINLSPPSGG